MSLEISSDSGGDIIDNEGLIISSEGADIVDNGGIAVRGLESSTNSLILDGVQERVNLGNDSSINFTRSNTFSFNAFINPNNNSNRIILSRRDLGSGWMWYLDSLGRLALYLRGSSGSNAILVRTNDGLFDLIEVKSTNKTKEEHIPDAAIQLYVLNG